MRKCYGIIWHHSLTDDNTLKSDTFAIDRYHTSWRYEGEIIPESHAKTLIAQGVEGVQTPWKMNGYNALIEEKDNKVVIYLRRDFHKMTGAHTVGYNSTHLGNCIIGNFDKAPPKDELLKVAAKLGAAQMRYYETSNNYMHRKFATYKSCPGEKFPWNKFLTMLATEYLIKRPKLSEVLEEYAAVPQYPEK